MGAALPKVREIENIAQELRVTIVDMLHKAGSGHAGGSLAMCEILSVLYYGEPRTTLDIDLVLSLPAGAVHRIAAAFPEPRFYSPPPEVLHLEASRPGRGHFNLLDL